MRVEWSAEPYRLPCQAPDLKRYPSHRLVDLHERADTEADRPV